MNCKVCGVQLPWSTGPSTCDRCMGYPVNTQRLAQLLAENAALRATAESERLTRAEALAGYLKLEQDLAALRQERDALKDLGQRLLAAGEKLEAALALARAVLDGAKLVAWPDLGGKVHIAVDIIAWQRWREAQK